MKTPKNILTYLIFFCAISLSCNENKFAEETKCLEKFSYKINSVNIDDDYSDLEFLKNILSEDSVQIVLLGEQIHEDGTTFEAKGRLIKYLHEECGFDVLAFESGIYDCYNAWQQIKADSNYEWGLKNSIFTLWVNVMSFKPLLNYLQSTLNTANPLELAGFDSQVTGNFVSEKLVSDIKASGLIEKNSPKLMRLDEFLKRIFPKNFMIRGGMGFPDSMQFDRDTLMLNELIQKLDSITLTQISGEKKTNVEFWRKVITGIKQMYVNRYLYGKAVYKAGNQPLTNFRDVLMAENLIWLTENYLKNKKIILWGANYHFVRNISEVERSIPDEDYKKNTITMGHVLWGKFKNKMYSVGFTSYKIQDENAANFDSLSVATEEDFILEDYSHEKKYEYAFINLRDAMQNSCMDFEYIAKPLGHIEQRSKWHNNFDGIFFIDKQKPSF